MMMKKNIVEEYLKTMLENLVIMGFSFQHICISRFVGYTILFDSSISFYVCVKRI